MKKLYILLCLTFLSLVKNSTNAQQMNDTVGTITHQTGLKFGINASRWVEGKNGLDNPPGSFKLYSYNVPGLQVGVWHQVTLSSKIALAAELYFATKGRTFKYIFNNAEKLDPERTMALTIPVLFRYKVLPKLSLEIGPAVNYVLSKYVQFEIGRERLYLDTWDISAMGGLLYQFSNRWGADLRYEYSFSNVLAYPQLDYKPIQNRSVQVSVNYQLRH